MTTNNKEGYNKLWVWFSLSRASFLTLPRVMMHDMPDEWQLKMAELLEEWDETWSDDINSYPVVKLYDDDEKEIDMPFWLQNYRRPDKDKLASIKRANNEN